MPTADRNRETAIEVLDLSLGYLATGLSKPFRAVEDANFKVTRGSKLFVLGESGSGKSTLLKFLAGRGRAQPLKRDRISVIAGQASTLGLNLKKLSRGSYRQLTALVSFIEQDSGSKLPPDLNIGDIIFQPIEERLKRFDRSELGQRVAELFDTLALPLSFLQKFPYELSKGQRQRVAVVRALLTDAPVLVADEPTLGVDANNRPRVVEAIKAFHARTDATMIIVSHDISLLEALATEVLVLQQSSIVGYGPINEIFRNAEDGYVFQLAQALRSTAYDEVAEE